MKDYKPLVSVVIPAFNRGKSLRSTVESVYANTYRPVEIVIVDDGSTDSTYDVGSELANELNSDNFTINVLSQKNKGAPSARNSGFKSSKGVYILFLDSDDEIAKNKISTHVEVMLQLNADASVSDFQIVYDQELGGDTRYISNFNPVKKVALNKSVGCSSTLLHRDLAQSVAWTESLPKFQDMDYFLKCLVLAKQVVHVPLPLYTYYRKSSGTISTSTTEIAIPYRTRILSLFYGANLNFSYPAALSSRAWGIVSLFYLLGIWLFSSSRKE